MSRDAMPQDVIDTITGAGYSVYMRDRADSYAIVAKGDKLAYVQINRVGPPNIASVHKPHRDHGTGFAIEPASITAEDLDYAANLSRPSWARGDSMPVKYAGIEAYRAYTPFNAAYRLIAQPKPTE